MASASFPGKRQVAARDLQAGRELAETDVFFAGVCAGRRPKPGHIILDLVELSGDNKSGGKIRVEIHGSQALAIPIVDGSLVSLSVQGITWKAPDLSAVHVPSAVFPDGAVMDVNGVFYSTLTDGALISDTVPAHPPANASAITTSATGSRRFIHNEKETFVCPHLKRSATPPSDEDQTPLKRTPIRSGETRYMDSSKISWSAGRSSLEPALSTTSVAQSAGSGPSSSRVTSSRTSKVHRIFEAAVSQLGILLSARQRATIIDELARSSQAKRVALITHQGQLRELVDSMAAVLSDSDVDGEDSEAMAVDDPVPASRRETTPLARQSTNVRATSLHATNHSSPQQPSIQPTSSRPSSIASPSTTRHSSEATSSRAPPPQLKEDASSIAAPQQPVIGGRVSQSEQKRLRKDAQAKAAAEQAEKDKVLKGRFEAGVSVGKSKLLCLKEAKDTGGNLKDCMIVASVNSTTLSVAKSKSWVLKADLEDHTAECSIGLFIKPEQKEMLPDIKKGDILVLTQVRNGNFGLACTDRDTWGWVLFPWQTPDNPASRPNHAKTQHLAKSPELRAYVGKLKTFWFSRHGEPDPADQAASVSQTPSLGRFRRINQFQEDFFSDCVAQVISYGVNRLNSMCCDLWVTDWTVSPELPEWPALVPNDDSGRFQPHPTSPFDQACFKIELWDDFANSSSNYQPGKMLFFRGIHVRRSDGRLEGKMGIAGDGLSADKIERRDQKDADVQELIKRRDTYLKERQAEWAALPVEQRPRPTSGAPPLSPSSRAPPPPSDCRSLSGPAALEAPDSAPALASELERLCSHPLFTVAELAGEEHVRKVKYVDCICQVVNIFSFEHSHRDIFVTDFTGNEKVKDAPLSDQGTLDSPPTRPFGKYVAKVTLWKSHGLLPALNQLRPGSFVRLCNVTCKPAGSAWFFNIQESSPFTAVHILPSNSRALQPLLKRRKEFYQTFGEPRGNSLEPEPVPRLDLWESSADLNKCGPKLIQDARSGDVFDSIVQFVSLEQATSAPRGARQPPDTLYVTDWTSHLLIPRGKDDRAPNGKVFPMAAFGQYVLPIVFEREFEQLNAEFTDRLAAGTLLRLTGLEVKDLGGALKGTLRDGAEVEILMDTSPEARPLLERRHRYYNNTPMSSKRDSSLAPQVPVRMAVPSPQEPPVSSERYPDPPAIMLSEAQQQYGSTEQAGSSSENCSDLLDLRTIAEALRAEDEAVFSVRAKVVGFSPPFDDLASAIGGTCMLCGQGLNQNERICQRCEGSSPETVEWVWRMSFQLWDGTGVLEADVGYDDECPAFPQLPPASSVFDMPTQALETLQQVIQTLWDSQSVEMNLCKYAFKVDGEEGMTTVFRLLEPPKLVGELA